MTDMLTSWVRTIVPAAWSALISLAVVHGILAADAAGPVGAVASTVLVPFVLGVLYAGLRWLETQPWMPRWFVLLLLGSTKTPAYTPPAPTPDAGGVP
jgi:hypothetical protein